MSIDLHYFFDTDEGYVVKCKMSQIVGLEKGMVGQRDNAQSVKKGAGSESGWVF